MQRWLLVLSLCTAAAAHADVLFERGHRATLAVDYTFESQGSTAGSLSSADWRVRRTLQTSVTLEAAPPLPIGQMHKPDAAQTATMDARAAAGQQAAAQIAPNIGNMMQLAAGAEALAAKCGDDEECFTREMQAYISGSNAAALGQQAGAVLQSVAPAMQPDAPRYQAWRQTAQASGRYSIDETLNVLSRDPGCIGQPKDTCVINEIRKGSGTTPGGGAGPAAIEADAQGKTLMVQLPVVLGLLAYTRTLMSTSSDDADEVGERPAQMAFPGKLELPSSHVSRPTDLGIAIPPLTIAIEGDTLPTSGVRTLEASGDSGEKVTLTIAWRLAVQ